MWADKKRRGWFIDFGLLGVVLYLTYPVGATYPPFDELKVTKGTLSFHQIGAQKNRRYPIFLDGEIYNCNVGPLGSNATCFDKRERAFFAGQQARVYWYKQGGRFGIYYPVAMQVEVSGRAVLDYKKQVRLIERGYVSRTWITLVLGGILFFLLRLIRHFPKPGVKADEHNKDRS